MARVKDLFEVSYGTNLELNALVEAPADVGVPFVSRTSRNNGVSAYVRRIDGLSPIPAGSISVAGGGSVMESFLQPRPFYCGRDMYVLSARSPMTDEQKLYYCLCLRANKYRFSYGRQANRTLRELEVPSLEELPSWVRPLPIDLSTAHQPAASGTPPRTPPAAWKKFLIGEVFDVKKGSRITRLDQRPGATPFIGAIDSNNGLSTFVDAEPLHPAGTITVNYNGNGVAEAFYQPAPYWCSDDVNVLYSKDGTPISPEVAMFIATVIRHEKYRFSYGRKWGVERMKASSILLPAIEKKGRSEPDWGFMADYIRHLPYSSMLEK